MYYHDLFTNVCCVSFVSTPEVGQLLKTIAVVTTTDKRRLLVTFDLCTLTRRVLWWERGCGRGCGLHLLTIQYDFHLK